MEFPSGRKEKAAMYEHKNTETGSGKDEKNVTESTAVQNLGALPTFLESFVIAFSMYSRIPMPFVEWSERGMKYAFCFFPLIGAVIGACVSVFAWAAARVNLGILTFALLGTAIPLLITGGIHMDGFLDVTDARSSFQSRERKLEILKDPHAGAFAIAGCGVYLLLYAAAFGELREKAFPAIAGIYVMTRALSGLSVLCFPKARKDGLAATFARGTGSGAPAVKGVLAIWLLAGIVFVTLTAGPVTAVILTVAAAASFLWYHHMAMHEFGGTTGDLAGYFLQTAELVMVAALAVCGRI